MTRHNFGPTLTCALMWTALLVFTVFGTAATYGDKVLSSPADLTQDVQLDAQGDAVRPDAPGSPVSVAKAHDCGEHHHTLGEAPYGVVIEVPVPAKPSKWVFAGDPARVGAAINEAVHGINSARINRVHTFCYRP